MTNAAMQLRAYAWTMCEDEPAPFISAMRAAADYIDRLECEVARLRPESAPQPITGTGPLPSPAQRRREYLFTIARRLRAEADRLEAVAAEIV